MIRRLWRLRFSWPLGSCVLCVRASFYLQGTRFEEGTEGYRTLRAVCIGVAGLAGCIALRILGLFAGPRGVLPALFFAASVAMNGWSVKKYVTVGITIPEKEDDEAPKLHP